MFLTKLNEVLASKKSFFADRLNYLSLGAAGLLNIIHWVILLSKIRLGQGNILLHYNVVYGTDLVQKSWYIYWIPGLALLLLLLNLVISSLFYKNEKLASYFLNFSSVIIQLIFLTGSLVLIVANA